MSAEFTYQFAIRMPNGELLSTPAVSNSIAALWGGSPRPTRLRVFDTRVEAEATLRDLNAEAAQIGITWTGWVEQRICSPFTVTDPSEAFVGEVQDWLEGGGRS